MSAGYDFFVSYAHEDLARVRRLDRALRELLRRPFRRAGFQVFRDERRLAAGSDLTRRLHEPMRESRALVVVLSPASSASPWVEKEIAFWCEELGRAEHMILVRVDPAVDLEWDDEAGTFRDPEKLPPALVRATRALPFYVELGDSTAADHEAAVRIAASLLGRAPEEIAGEDYRLQRRRRRLAISAVTGLAVLTVVAMVAGVLAVRASNTAKDNEQRAVADLLANRGIVEQDDRPDKALALAVAARRRDERSEGRSVLLRLLRDLHRRDRFYRLDTEPTAIAVSPSGDMLAVGDENGGVRVARLPADRLPDAAQTDLGGRVLDIDFADDDRLVAGIEGNKVVELSLPDLETTAELDTPYFAGWAFNRPTGLIALGGLEPGDEPESGSTGRLTLLRVTPRTLEVVKERTFAEDELLPYANALAFDPGGSRLVISAFGGARLVDVPSLAYAGDDDGLTAFGNAVAVAFPKRHAVVLGGDPQPSNDFTGLVDVRTTSGEHSFGTVELGQSVGVLTPCRGAVAFGTDAGEYGLIADPLGDTRPIAGTRAIADVSGAIRDIACEKRGPLAVAAADGLVHLRDHPTTSRFDAPSQSALLLFVPASGAAPEEIDLRGMGLSGDGGHLILRDGSRLKVTGADRDRVATVATGSEKATANCIAVDYDTLQRFGADDRAEPLALGRCGDVSFRVRGEDAATLEILRGEELVTSIPAGRRGGTYALAVSADARQMFVGGYFESTLYDISDPAAPQPVVQLPSSAFIGNASFAAGGDVLLTAEYFPPSYSYAIHVTAIDGPALEDLACAVGAGDLQGTLATRVLSGDALRPCD